MSTSVYWQPAGETHDLPGPGGELAQALRATFGDFPLTLTTEHYQRLRAMANVSGGDSDTNPYLALVEAIEQHHAVIVTINV